MGRRCGNSDGPVTRSVNMNSIEPLPSQSKPVDLIDMTRRILRVPPADVVEENRVADLERALSDAQRQNADLRNGLQHATEAIVDAERQRDEIATKVARECGDVAREVLMNLERLVVADVPGSQFPSTLHQLMENGGSDFELFGAEVARQVTARKMDPFGCIECGRSLADCKPCRVCDACGDRCAETWACKRARS
jgi:hypothetical protein